MLNAELAARLKQALATSELASASCPHCQGWGLHRWKIHKDAPWGPWYEDVTAPDSVRSAMPREGYSTPICPACKRMRPCESYLVLGTHDGHVLQIKVPTTND